MNEQTALRSAVAAMVLLLISAFCWSNAAAQTAAGQVMFSFGSVTVTGADGAVREARRGEQIFPGDTIATEVGRVQIKYTDGSLVSLVPNTVYRVDDYSFSGSVDGTERGFFRLVKGGLRTVTGAIGRGDKANYRMTTPVATIGIRGTWFRAFIDQFGRLLVSVGFDPDDPSGLIVANVAGQIDLDQGENAIVENANTPPVRTEQQVVLEVPPPSQETQFVAGDERDGATQTVLVATGPVLFTNAVAAITDNATEPPAGVGSESFKNGTAIGFPPTTLLGIDTSIFADDGFATIDIDTAQKVTDPAIASQIQFFLAGADPADISFFRQRPAQVANFQTIDNVLLMGRWTGGRILFIEDEFGTIQSEVDDLTGSQSLHFVIGPTPTSALPAPGAGTFTYNLAGTTPSTSESGATIGSGVTSGTLVLNAAGAVPFVSVNMNVQHNLVIYNVSGGVDISGFAFGNQFGGSVFATAGSGACNPSCGADIDGTFAGAGTPPSHAGVAYIINEFDRIHGVAGFRFTPPPPVTPPPFATNQVAAVADNATTFPAGVATDSFSNVTTIGAPITTAFGVDVSAMPSNSFVTIDPNTALNVTNPTVLGQVTTFLGGANPADVTFFQASPATVAESQTIDGVLALTRWSGGRILVVTDEGGPLQSEVDDLTGFQSLHLVSGPTPSVPLPAPFSGIFAYNFAGSTDSTSESGATIGNGVVSGQLFLDAGGAVPFVQIFNMVVNHNAVNYNVNGNVDISGFAFGNQFGGGANAVGGVGACSASCPANINGTFAGAGSPPSHAGLAYIITETDKIHGVAAFRK